MAPFVDSSDAAVRFESLYRFKPVVRVLNGDRSWFCWLLLAVCCVAASVGVRANYDLE